MSEIRRIFEIQPWPIADRLGLMSSAFSALIWWAIPAIALIGALGYVLWITQFKDKYETQTTRSVTAFQKFQDSFNQAQVIKSDDTETDK